MGQLFGILNEGGIFMYGILTASIVAMAVIFQRLFTLWVKFRIDACFHKLLVCIKSGAKLKTARPGNYQRWRKLRQDLGKINWRNQRIFLRIGAAEVAERRPFRRRTWRHQASLA